MKKSETIAMYRDAYLEGRDEIDRRNFEEKDEARQYAAIMSWKRRQEIAAGVKETPAVATPAIILDLIKRAHKALMTLDDLSPKDTAKLSDACGKLKEDIDSYAMIVKGRRLKELRDRLSSLSREIEQLESEGARIPEE